MQQRTLENPKVEPVWNSTIAAYKTDAQGEVCGVTLQSTVDGSTRELVVRCVFMAIGHTPVSNYAGDLVERDAAGFVVTAGAGTATKTPGLFAAGDCTGGPLQVSKAVGEGLIAGQSAAAYAAELLRKAK
jgi:thioredoxin reductase (NADPH)